MTLPRRKRRGFLVQRVHLIQIGCPICTRDEFSPSVLLHFRNLFGYALPYSSKPKILVSLYLLRCANKRTSFPVRNPITSVRQGALPFGDWVFSVVDYPFHKRKFNIKPSSRTGLVSQFFRSVVKI